MALMLMSATVRADDKPPTGIKVNDNTLVPLRFIAEWFGATVDFDDANNLITLHTDKTTMQLSLNSIKAMIGEENYSLTAPVITKHETTYVPLRFVAEGFKAGVDWDEAKQQATIVNRNTGKTIIITISTSISTEQKSIYLSAVTQNNISKVRLLLKEQPDLVFCRTEFGGTSLHLAVSNGSLPMTALLLSYGAEINAKDHDGMTPLPWLIYLNSNNEIPGNIILLIKLLLAHKADVNTKDTDGRSPLYWGSEDLSITKILISNGADVNIADNNGVTPLHESAFLDITNVAQYLILHGAHVNARTKEMSLVVNNDTFHAKSIGCITPLGYAECYNNKKVVNLLRKYGGHL